MRVNTKLRYGLRAMLQIAEGYGAEPVPIRVIAENQEISGKYLEQVVGNLRKAGLLTRDSRIKERKKPGLKRARKAPTYTKR